MKRSTKIITVLVFVLVVTSPLIYFGGLLLFLGFAMSGGRF